MKQIELDIVIFVCYCFPFPWTSILLMMRTKSVNQIRECHETIKLKLTTNLRRMAMTSAGTPLNTEDPATIIFAPAFAASSIVSGPSPPSTSMLMVGIIERKVATYNVTNTFILSN